MSWDKRADLDRVQAEGKRCLLERDRHEFQMKTAENEKALVEVQVAAIDRATAALMASKPNPEFFGSAQNLAQWRAQLDELASQRAEFMKEVGRLNSVICGERLQAVKLTHQINTLLRSQQNLKNAIDGSGAAEGWKGGVYRV
jgi:hypothetical protein